MNRCSRDWKDLTCLFSSTNDFSCLTPITPGMSYFVLLTLTLLLVVSEGYLVFFIGSREGKPCYSSGSSQLNEMKHLSTSRIC